MSRFLIYNEDGTIINDEIESMEVCKWRIDDICCNDSSPYLADYPYPREICHIDCKRRCEYFEEEKEEDVNA